MWSVVGGVVWVCEIGCDVVVDGGCVFEMWWFEW